MENGDFPQQVIIFIFIIHPKQDAMGEEKRIQIKTSKNEKESWCDLFFSFETLNFLVEEKKTACGTFKPQYNLQDIIFL